MEETFDGAVEGDCLSINGNTVVGRVFQCRHSLRKEAVLQYCCAVLLWPGPRLARDARTYETVVLLYCVTVCVLYCCAAVTLLSLDCTALLLHCCVVAFPRMYCCTAVLL